ncbi:hypothetical protein PT974_02153 [Cladobotryum mycophilum]|uniref:Uncharacterized protein n=1 Tax=Cladobotryum mycophilum TaxID=491253 RepID=A0ABR0SYI0_9HYPO
MAPLAVDQRAKAKRVFYHVIEHFEGAEDGHDNQYNRPRLVRLTYEYAA